MIFAMNRAKEMGNEVSQGGEDNEDIPYKWL